MKQQLISQYDASLSMLKNCIEQYDENIWFDCKNYTNSAWHIAYHVIFFANIYSCCKESDIRQWSKETEYYHILGKTPWPPHEKILLEKSYSKTEILEYLQHVNECIPSYLEAMNANENCWPSWYNLSQFEFHLNNIRHIQHHTAQLLERHNTLKRISVEWSKFQ